MFKYPTPLVPSLVQLLRLPDAGVPKTGAVSVLLDRVWVSVVPTTSPLGVVLLVVQPDPVETAMPAPGYVIPPADATAAATNAVVAICVVLVPPAAVGAVGVPVRDGLVSVLLVRVCVPFRVTSPLALSWV